MRATDLTHWYHCVSWVGVRITQTPEAEPADARQAAVLEAAVGVFARYGYRKTSMDEVARAAGVSRQGLYLQFANKEELFPQAVGQSLNRHLNAALPALSRPD